MFNLFKKNKDELASPMTGTVTNIAEVKDPVFASKAMGDGFAVEPTSGEVYSPVIGKVVSVFPTKHAIGLLSETGAEILVHIGINTVELDGKGYDILVTEGDSVTFNSKLANVDLDYLKSQNKPVTTMVIWTNCDDKTVSVKTGTVTAKTVIGSL